MSIFTTEVLSYEEEKLPTLLQYLQAKNYKSLPKAFHVSIIWLPNKFPSYNLECDKFRVSIPSKSSLGRHLSEHLSLVFNDNIPLAIALSIRDDKKVDLLFVESKEVGHYEEIGTAPAAYRFISG
jgi:hypothetical protein